MGILKRTFKHRNSSKECVKNLGALSLLLLHDMKKLPSRHLLLHIALCLTFPLALTAQEVTRHVDPRIGSVGLGRVFIGPCLPFGMAKPGPDCGTGHNAGWAPLPAAVSGFSQTHVSGTGGGPKYGNILVRPFHGADQHRESEQIELGKYSCTFRESGIRAELTASRRASFYRFTYPNGTMPYYEIDLTHFLGRSPIPKAREAQQFEEAHLDSLITPQGEKEYFGHQTISGGWNNGAPYTVYFWTKSQADTTYHPHYEKPQESSAHALQGGRHKSSANRLLLKVGISFLSAQEARANMENDLPDWDFEATHLRCLREWEVLLKRLPIAEEATTQVKRMYYTALYHTCLMPTERKESCGLSALGGGRTTEAPYYDDYYAIWDTYRTSTPLLTELCPERATAIAQSLLTIYQHEGFLPDARSGNSNGRTQGGSNAEIVLCDALARGLDIDAEKALEAMLKDATVAPQDDEAEGRGGLAAYNGKGYIPYGTARAGNRTVEYSFCDWAIAQTARLLASRESSPDKRKKWEALSEQYMQQSENWKNLWRSDCEHHGVKGFIMPKDEKGNWLDDLLFGHSQARPLTFRYTPDVSYEGPWYCKWWDCFMYEASSWEYSFSIPHDIPGLIEMCGGPEAFEARLDTFFARKYYNVANEPSFLTPLLYHWTGKPEKSTALIRRIVEENFSDQPDGLPGNDDGGAMSSWLAFHLLGRYPLAGTDRWLNYEPILSLDSTRYLMKADAQPEALKTCTHRVNFALHGQTRRFYMNFHKGGKVTWYILRNLRWWHGSYTHSPKALEKGNLLCYEQPLNGQHIDTPDNETFLLLSRRAFRDIQRKGYCQYDKVRWTLTAREDDLWHLRSEEEAEMWVKEVEGIPLIMKMKNNPIEIDWTIETL